MRSRKSSSRCRFAWEELIVSRAACAVESKRLQRGENAVKSGAEFVVPLRESKRNPQGADFPQHGSFSQTMSSGRRLKPYPATGMPHTPKMQHGPDWELAIHGDLTDKQ